MIFTNISNLCKGKGVSIARLEKECGLGNATVRRWDTSSPNIDNLKRVADYLGVSIEHLMSNPTAADSVTETQSDKTDGSGRKENVR